MSDNKINGNKFFECLVSAFFILSAMFIAGMGLYGLVLLAINYPIPFGITSGIIIWFTLTICLYNSDIDHKSDNYSEMK